MVWQRVFRVSCRSRCTASPLKTLSKFAGREVTGPQATSAVLGTAGAVSGPRSSDTCEYSCIVPASRMYARRSFSVRIGGVRPGQHGSLRTRPSCDSGPVKGTRKARRRRCCGCRCEGSRSRARWWCRRLPHTRIVVAIAPSSSRGSPFSSTASDPVGVDYSGSRSARRRQNRR